MQKQIENCEIRSTRRRVYADLYFDYMYINTICINIGTNDDIN